MSVVNAKDDSEHDGCNGEQGSIDDDKTLAGGLGEREHDVLSIHFTPGCIV